MRFIQERFYFETTGLETNPSRSIYCANSVNTMMGMAVSYLLVDMEPIERNKKMVFERRRANLRRTAIKNGVTFKVVEMMENIHWAFDKIVKQLNWMDETTKARTLYKAQQMKTFVGFPELINDPEQLDELTSDVFQKQIFRQLFDEYWYRFIFSNSSRSSRTIILATSYGTYNWTWTTH